VEKTCKNCVWRHVDSCRRIPPMVVVLRGGDVITRFPKVNADLWCGEFKLREEIKQETGDEK